MKIKTPCIITSRLLPGFRIGKAEISIDYADFLPNGQTKYLVFIDLPNYTYKSTDLISGCHGGNLQGGLESLCSFLEAFIESRSLDDPTSDNWNLFPNELADWAIHNSDEISLIGLLLSEADYQSIILE